MVQPLDQVQKQKNLLAGPAKRLGVDLLEGATFWGGFVLCPCCRGLVDCCSSTEAEISLSSGCDYSADSVADSVEGCALGFGEQGYAADSSEDFAVGFGCCDNEAAIVGGFCADVVMILFDEGWRFASYLGFGYGCVQLVFHGRTHRGRFRGVNHFCDHHYLILFCHSFHAFPCILGNGIDLKNFEP
mmetsp:Transcript_43572/g.91247  ORF Transcript_43572/g.91247 Transcript_43572/m.91247 type:complete len:187 (+) Transcript_43572:667-1227(+)